MERFYNDVCKTKEKLRKIWNVYEKSVSRTSILVFGATLKQMTLTMTI